MQEFASGNESVSVSPYLFSCISYVKICVLFRDLVQAYLPADQGQLLIKSAITVMVVQTECMSLVNAAPAAQTVAPSTLRGHLSGETSVNESGNAGHSAQTLVEVSSTSPPLVKRHSVQLLDARTLEDPAGTLMSTDEALVISDFEQINVFQLKREASGIGLTAISPSANEALPTAKEPVKTRHTREPSTDDGVRKLMSELCDAPPSGSFKSFHNAFSDEAVIPQSSSGDQIATYRPGSLTRTNASDRSIQSGPNEIISDGPGDIALKKDDTARCETSESNRINADSGGGKDFISPPKRRTSLGQPLAHSSAIQTPLTDPINGDVVDSEKPWREDANDGESRVQQEAFATDEHMLHLDSDFTSEGSRVDFENNTTIAVLANDFHGNESQVAEIDAIRHAIPGGSIPDQRVSDSGIRPEQRGISADTAPLVSSGGAEKKSDGFYEVLQEISVICL